MFGIQTSAPNSRKSLTISALSSSIAIPKGVLSTKMSEFDKMVKLNSIKLSSMKYH